MTFSQRVATASLLSKIIGGILPVGFRYLRLQSSNDITVTATIAAKM